MKYAVYAEIGSSRNTAADTGDASTPPSVLTKWRNSRVVRAKQTVLSAFSSSSGRSDSEKNIRPYAAKTGEYIFGRYGSLA